MKSVVSICPVGAIRQTERASNVFLENALEKEMEERGRGGGRERGRQSYQLFVYLSSKLACSRKVPSNWASSPRMSSRHLLRTTISLRRGRRGSRSARVAESRADLNAKKALCEEDVGIASEVTTTSFELTFLEHANSDNS